MVLTLMHSLSLLAILFLPIFWPLKAVAGVILIASLFYYLRRHAWLEANNSIIEVEINTACSCTVHTRGGERYRGSLLPATFITSHLVILNLARDDSRARLAVVIFADAVDAERFRELRVLLKWKCGKLQNRV